MGRSGCLLLALIAAWLPAQDSRPESRPGSALFVLGATATGDRIFKVDAATLRVTATYATSGAPSYAGLTPDGEGLIVATTRAGLNVTRGTIAMAAPATLEGVWTQASDDMLSWRGPSWYPVVTDPTAPDIVAMLHLSSFDLPDQQNIMNWSAELISRRGVRTMVQLPEQTNHLALWNRDEQIELIAVTTANRVWRIEARSGTAREITSRPVATSGLLHSSDPSATFIDALTISHDRNEAVCFTRGGEALVVRLDSGDSSRRQLGSDLVAGRWPAFVRYHEGAGRYVICRQDDYCGGNLFAVLDRDLKETASMAVMGPPFLDAVFSADGSRFATLTANGVLRIHDGSTAAEVLRSEEALPFLKGSNHCASFAGWR